jgi:hypothetical protein
MEQGGFLQIFPWTKSGMKYTTKEIGGELGVTASSYYMNIRISQDIPPDYWKPVK